MEAGELLVEESDRAVAANKSVIEVERLHNKINEIYKSETDKPSLDPGQWADQFFKSLPLREEQKRIAEQNFRSRSLDQIKNTQDLFVGILKFIDGRMEELHKRGLITEIIPENTAIYIEWDSTESQDISIRKWTFLDGRVRKLLLRRGKIENGIFREKSYWERYPELYLKGKEGEALKIRGVPPTIGGSDILSVYYGGIVDQDVVQDEDEQFFNNLAKAYDKLMEGFF